MKPSPFAYAAPATLTEAVALLAAHDGDARVLSGGQSLMPVLNFRLAAPSLLVDLGRIAGLNRIEPGEDELVLGARVRWRDIEDDARLEIAHPLLRAAIAHVAHYQIRNRGTVGGSLAHADPASEMPGVAVTCDAVIETISSSGQRAIAARDFLLGPLTTALQPGEIITAVRLPAWRDGRRWAFEEFARRRGDFAMAGIIAYWDQDANGCATNAHIGAIGASPRAHRLPSAEAALNGSRVDQAVIEEAARLAGAAVDPSDDIHASAAYRRALVTTLATRALTRAAA
jgi:carbon-monoxide dehydrogenase medium subunit